ncbi:hypothetical protein EJB05_04396, partial [Eragrostis curvula]
MLITRSRRRLPACNLQTHLHSSKRPSILAAWEMSRRFLNLVMENLDTGLYSLRRLNLSQRLFYPSTAAAEAATARSEAAVKANAERPAGYKHGLRFLNATATSLDPLPAASINFKPCGPSNLGDTPLDLVALLGDEGRILCADAAGRTSLYDADAHAVVTVPDLKSYKGRGAIPICIARDDGRDTSDGGCSDQGGSMYVLRLRLDVPDCRDDCFEEIRFDGGWDIFNGHQPFRGWRLHGGERIRHLYVSCSDPRGFGTYAFDTERWQWWHAGKWRLPFFDRAEYVPELNLWSGLSSCRPFHLCASDLSTMDFERPPVILQTLADFDMPKSWSPIRLDLINLGSGRFCVVKMFHCTRPPVGMGYSDEDGDDDEVFDYPDLIHWEFTVLTGIEVVCCDGELLMIKHMSKYHMFKDDVIHWAL